MHIWKWSKWNRQIKGEAEPQIAIFFVTKWSSQTRIVLHLIELLVSSWESPNQGGYFQDYMLLFTNWWKVPIAEDNTYTMHWHGEVELVPT